MKKRLLAALLTLAMVMALAVPAFAAESTLPTKFKDVKAGKYYTEAVIWAVDAGVTDGVSKTKFAPDQECTEKEIITFLWRALTKPEPDAPTAPIKVSKSYQKAINWAYANHIIDYSFDPDKLCTRANSVTYIWKAFGSERVAEEEEKSFKDVASDAAYADAVSWAAATGVTDGTTKTKFSPDEVCDRGQIVTFLMRARNPTE